MKTTIPFFASIRPAVLAGMASVFLLFTQCKKQDPVELPPNPNEEELITTMILSFTDSAASQKAAEAIFRDADGEGGSAPTRFDTIYLQANKTYYTDALLLDESAIPGDTISNEIAEEANDHQFFFHPANVPLSIRYNDEDTQGPPQPIGLKTIWKTTATGTGSVTIRLKHQPGQKTGNEAAGETDLEIVFPVSVK